MGKNKLDLEEPEKHTCPLCGEEIRSYVFEYLESMERGECDTPCPCMCFSSWKKNNRLKEDIEKAKQEGYLKGRREESMDSANAFLSFLESIEDKFDKINGLKGNKEELCVYCGSKVYNAELGIIHKRGCPLLDIRIEIGIGKGFLERTEKQNNQKNEKIKWCGCGDSTNNEDGVCDTCRLLDELEKPNKPKEEKDGKGI